MSHSEFKGGDAASGQAAGLRRLRAPKPVQVIAVTSGKGGVGKTSVSVNLAVSMAQAGKRVMLLDGDLGLANVDVMLGLQPTYNLSHVIAGQCTLDDTIIEGPSGVMVVPASSGKRNMAELSGAEHIGLVRAFSELQRPLDTLIVDTAAGIADSVITFSQASQQVVVVVTSDPQSLTDAYALIKVLNRDHGIYRVHVLANQVHAPREANEIFENLRRVAERFLDVTLSSIGFVPHDDWLKRAVRRQRAVVDAYPAAPSAIAFRELAATAMNWGAPLGARGNLEFFVERLIGTGALPAGVSA
ncbi:MinD/ParA family protein [Solimonas soli]|uniref:MinD/ParA family protein n=1 Tax=Solimonas soli TaxID=413479 RepID=UPI0004BB221C|nr:MinD/ParA family protein [Solimonas soli]